MSGRRGPAPARSGDGPAVQLVRGVARLRLGRHEEARADLDAVIELGRVDALGLLSKRTAARSLLNPLGGLTRSGRSGGALEQAHGRPKFAQPPRGA